MARPLRIEYEGAIYHVTARGNERGKIFFSKRDYEKFREYIAEAQLKFGLILHAYVLMTNHYHLIIETPEKNLSRIMHHINSSYTSYTNIKRKRSGHLFQGRYKAILVDKDSYLLELSRYLHLNPVRVNMVQRPEEYAQSSYGTYTGSRTEKLVSNKLILDMLDKDETKARERYRVFVESALGEPIESPSKKVYGGIILGGERFIREVLSRIESEQVEVAEISHRKALRKTVGMEELTAAVCKHYRVSWEEITRNKRSEARKAAIYLVKKYTGASNQEIGELFGNVSYSAVAKVCQSFANQMKEDRELQRRIEEFMKNNSTFKA